MIALYLVFLGWLAFVIGTVVLGYRLRQQPSRENAERFSRVIHFLFFAGLGAPLVISFFTPGFTHLDALVGLSPLPMRTLLLIVGILLAIPGLYLMGVSNLSLRAQGSGTNAFVLTRRVVETDIYRRTRNPMSLGYYLLGAGIGFISGSSLLTLYVLIGLIPAHLFCLKYFEELELSLRFGESYQEYRQKVPFLLPKLSGG